MKKQKQKVKKMKQYLSLMVHHRAPLRNKNFFKPQILYIPQILSENSKPFWGFCSVRVKKIHPPKDEGLRGIEHNITMALNTRKSNFRSH